MTIKTGLSIYNKSWYIEPQAALVLLGDFERMRDGGLLQMQRREDREVKKPVQLEGATIAPTDTYDLRNDFAGFTEKVAVILVEGPMMKDGFCWSIGTTDMAELVRKAEAADVVERIVLLFDTPGGASDSVAPLAEALQECTKKTIALVSSSCCSAGYFAASYCAEIYCAEPGARVGSIGTMMSWWDSTKAMEEEGYVRREFYATASKDKNKAFNEANAGNGKKLIQEILDPVNNLFMQAVATNRGLDAASEVLTGKVYYAADAQQLKMVDGIKTLRTIIKETQNSSHSSSPKTTMKTQNLTPFALTIAAMQGDALQVVDGGFLVTEANLASVEAHLKENSVAGINARLDQMASQSGDLKTANEKIADLNRQLETANAENERLKAENEALGTEPGEVLATVSPGNKDPKSSNEAAAYDESQEDYMQDAATFLGK